MTLLGLSLRVVLYPFLVFGPSLASGQAGADPKEITPRTVLPAPNVTRPAAPRASELAAQASAAQQQYYWVCQATVSDQRGSTVLAVSKVFPAAPGLSLTQLGIGTAAWNKVTIAWHRYVLHKYSPDQEQKLDGQGYFANGAAAGPLGTCTAGIQSAVQGTHDRAVNGGTVEQDWVYSPTQSAATSASPTAVSAGVAPPPSTGTPLASPAGSSSSNPCAPVQTLVGHKFVLVTPPGCPAAAAPQPSPAPPRPAAPPPAQTNTVPPSAPTSVSVAPSPAPAPFRAPAVSQASPYAYCYGPTVPRTTMYFSAPFQIKSSATQPEVQAFQQFLREQYKVEGGASCIRRPTLEALQQEMEQRKARASAQRQVTDTGWKFQ